MTTDLKIGLCMMENTAWPRTLAIGGCQGNSRDGLVIVFDLPFSKALETFFA